MTDRLKGVVVLFREDLRQDDAEALMNAIRCLKDVIAVAPAKADADDWMNRERVRQELCLKLFEVLGSDKGG